MSAASSTPRWALVRLVDGSSQRGLIYTVDPESQHLVLLQPSADAMDGETSFRACVIPAHAVTAIMQDAAPAPCSVDALRRTHDGGPRASEMSETRVEQRRADLCVLLRAQRAPFEERPDGELIVFGCVHIRPPYTARACRCDNEMVLDRFLDMLRTSPSHVETMS